MSKLAITGVTVSFEVAEKEFGTGKRLFASATSKVPDEDAGIPIEAADEAIHDGLDLYLVASQTALQSRLASGEMSGTDYKLQTAQFLKRIGQVRTVYAHIRNMTPDQLDEYIARTKAIKEGQQ